MSLSLRPSDEPGETIQTTLLSLNDLLGIQEDEQAPLPPPAPPEVEVVYVPTPVVPEPIEWEPADEPEPIAEPQETVIYVHRGRNRSKLVFPQGDDDQPREERLPPPNGFKI